MSEVIELNMANCKMARARAEIHMKSGVTDALIAEMVSQDFKWGADRNLEPLFWNAILGEEVGEVSKAILENDPNLRNELIQVAAVAMQWVECIDRNSKGAA